MHAILCSYTIHTFIIYMFIPQALNTVYTACNHPFSVLFDKGALLTQYPFNYISNTHYVTNFLYYSSLCTFAAALMTKQCSKKEAAIIMAASLSMHVMVYIAFTNIVFFQNHSRLCFIYKSILYKLAETVVAEQLKSVLNRYTKNIFLASGKLSNKEKNIDVRKAGDENSASVGVGVGVLDVNYIPVDNGASNDDTAGNINPVGESGSASLSVDDEVDNVSDVGYIPVNGNSISNDDTEWNINPVGEGKEGDGHGNGRPIGRDSEGGKKEEVIGGKKNGNKKSNKEIAINICHKAFVGFTASTIIYLMQKQVPFDISLINGGFIEHYNLNQADVLGKILPSSGKFASIEQYIAYRCVWELYKNTLKETITSSNIFICAKISYKEMFKAGFGGKEGSMTLALMSNIICKAVISYQILHAAKYCISPYITYVLPQALIETMLTCLEDKIDELVNDRQTVTL